MLKVNIAQWILLTDGSQPNFNYKISTKMKRAESRPETDLGSFQSQFRRSFCFKDLQLIKEQLLPTGDSRWREELKVIGIYGKCDASFAETQAVVVTPLWLEATNQKWGENDSAHSPHLPPTCLFLSNV